MVRAVAEKNVYKVLLVHRDENVTITVETALSPVPLQSPGPVQSRARVTRVIPHDEFPVRAVELEP
jgi:hypothetical protein